MCHGDRVGFVGLNQPAFFETMFAAARLGAIFVPLNFRLTTPEAIAVPYTLGTFISASISEPRERDQYTFTLTAPTRLV